MRATCKSCIYCILLTGAGREVFVCANKYGRPGRLSLTEPASACGNHRKTKIVNRPSVTQPVDGDIRFIPLTQGKVAVVDAADYDWLRQYKWYANKKSAGFYACTHKSYRLLYMHRLITDAPAELVVDHIDRNSLNNRRSNLRLCTYQQNIFNQRGRKGTSRYKGVHWDKQKKAWTACIEKNDKAIKLGFFDDETSAAKAYDKKAGELFGEFAYLNLPGRRATVNKNE